MPTLLSVGKGPVPPLILKQFNESLSVSSCMDFMLASNENHLTCWLTFFTNMVLHLNHECELLKAQVNEYCEMTTAGIHQQEKADFIKLVSPAIKNGMFQIFLHLILPSTLCTLEVTMRTRQECILIVIPIEKAIGQIRKEKKLFYGIFH